MHLKTLFISSFALLFSAFQISLSADEIVSQAENKLRGESSYSEMSMQIVRPDWTREMKMKSWSLGDEFALILITEPARDAGTAFLKRKNEIWNWQPTIERVVKLPPSMMSQSWMGSDFTNDDLVQESSRVKDFSHTLICLLYTSPSPRDLSTSRMPSSA